MSTPYSSLLSTARFRPSIVTQRSIVAEAESDRGRLLFCAAFRRLQQKAQVFSMEPNAAVRSRLTHSFEVSQMGRYIADLVAKHLRQAGLASEDECTALVTFVETACLMHDIGNPPFGHFGEAAIATWFKSNGPEMIMMACGSGSTSGTIGTEDPRLVLALADFLNFDGNPQGLRTVTKLQRNSDEHGLNLTKTSIGSFLKYIRSTKPGEKIIDPNFSKKCGFFLTEAHIVEQVWQQFSFAKPQRFPLAYIMEAADDLAYCISDLEDSIEKDLLNEQIALSEIYGLWKASSPDKSDPLVERLDAILLSASRGTSDDGSKFTYIDFRTNINREIVEFCASQYTTAHDQILAGTHPPLLTTNSPAGQFLQILKDYCRRHVYCHESVQRVELAGYAAIYGLLENFRCLLEASFDRFTCSLDYAKTKDSVGTPIILEKKLLALFPRNYITVYRDDLAKVDRIATDFSFKEWQLRAHLVTDFLAGMTDDFAMTTFRTLSGMRL